MSSMAEDSWSTARSGPSLATRMAISALAFAVAAGGIYWIGLDRPGRSEGHSAAATVIETAARGDVQGDSQPDTAAGLQPVQQRVANEIISEANLRRALPYVDPPPGTPDQGDAIARLRRNLRVSVAESSTPGRLEVTVACSGDNPQQAVRLVNRLAEQYARDRRDALQATVVEACRRIGQQRQASRQDLLVARSRLDQFLQRHFQEHHGRAESLVEAADTDDSPATPVAEDPAWKALAREHQDHLEHRADLLATHAPRHPAIAELDRKIAKLEATMDKARGQVSDEDLPAVVARPMIGAAPMPPPPDDPAGPRPSTAQRPQAASGLTAEEHGRVALEYFALAATLDRAQEEYGRLAEARWGAVQRRLDLPALELRLAQPPEPAGAPTGSTRLLLVALAAGLAMAAAAMSFQGSGGDLVLENVAQAQAALPVPIVGVIPSETSLRPPPASAAERRSNTAV